MEIRDAIRYYERDNWAIAFDFVDALSNTVQIIREHPHVGRVAGPRLRKIPVKGFPYLLYYKVGNQAVSLASLFHTSRDVEPWQQ